MLNSGSRSVSIRSNEGLTLSLDVDRLDTPAVSDAIQGVLMTLQLAGEPTHNGGDQATWLRLVRRSQKLTDLVLTADQQSQLDALADESSLTIDAALRLHRFPWELLRTRHGFLCERFCVSRLVNETSDASARVTSVASGAAAVVVPDAGPLIGASTELTSVARRLRMLAHDFPQKLQSSTEITGEVQAATLLQAVGQSHWLHFAGHVPVVDGVRCLALRSTVSASAIAQLADGLFRPSHLADAEAVPSTVILNGCGALELPEVDIQAQGGTIPKSLASEFLRKGTQHLLGPAVAVLDSQTAAFMTPFYDAVLQGCSFGTAVLLARRQARQKLGAHSLLPISYVLYGDPNAIPFPRTQSRGQQPSVEPPRNVGGAENKDFPCTCHLCGKTIETRHGVARLEPDLIGDEPVVTCRDCHRREQQAKAGDVPRDIMLNASRTVYPSAVSASKTAGGNPPFAPVANAAAAAHVLTPDCSEFRRHVSECLNRPWTLLNPLTGERSECRFQRSTGKKPAVLRTSLDALSQPKHTQTETLTFHVVGANALLVGELILVIRELPAGKNSLPSAVQSTEAEIPVDREMLQRILSETSAAQETNRQTVVICSESGFDELLLAELSGSKSPAWYSGHRTILLFDIRTKIMHSRRSDVFACQFQSLLQRARTEDQFVCALNWLEQQLPLPASLSCREIAEELSLERDAVETAMQVAAFRHNLLLDQTTEYGLVVSERNPAELVQPRADGATAHRQVVPATPGTFRLRPFNWHGLLWPMTLLRLAIRKVIRRRPT